MRLIDADKVIARAKEEAAAMSEPFKSQFGLLVEWIVGKTSTTYDADKVVEQLKKVEAHCLDMHDWQGQSAVEEAIEIVKAGGTNE